jgi:hypothetical protein
MNMHAKLHSRKPRQPHRRSPLRRMCIVWLATLLSACSALPGADLPTAIPSEMLPTVIAMTMEASRPTLQALISAQPVQEIVPSDTPTALPPTPAPPSPTSAPSATATQASELSPNPPSSPPDSPVAPDADIILRNIGQLSRLASPITINAYLEPGADGRVQIDLLGEDRRVLARQIKVLNWVDRDGKATLYMKLEFEIPGTAEVGRLAISTTDQFGRLTALNSIPVILISIGESDILPVSDRQAAIAVLVPQPRTLVQGKTLLVYGLARPAADDYLVVQLIAEDGSVVGKRVTRVEPAGEESHGSFTVEVPYHVEQPTSALLTVWQGEDSLSDIIYLTTVEVMLSP